MWDQFFDGYCPESKLNGEKVRMRLNAHDFFESEKTGLQIAISYPGVHAVVLKFRGKGDFRKTVTYADEVENGELLSPQLVDRFPYCGDDLFGSKEEFVSYLNNEVEIMNNLHQEVRKTALVAEDFETFWFRLYFDLNKGYLVAAFKRAYRDFSRTIKNMPISEVDRSMVRAKWFNDLQEDIEALLIIEFVDQTQFDNWHRALSNKLVRPNGELQLAVGQAQKWINMSLKYLFLMGEKYVPGIGRNYRFFHIPIDNIIQQELENKYQISKLSVAWSKLSNYDTYLDYQKAARRAFLNKIPMDEEFKLFNSAYLGAPSDNVQF